MTAASSRAGGHRGLWLGFGHGQLGST